MNYGGSTQTIGFGSACSANVRGNEGQVLGNVIGQSTGTAVEAVPSQPTTQKQVMTTRKNWNSCLQSRVVECTAF